MLAVERFDRNVTVLQSELHVARLHQEDFAQAFGITSASKYAELQGGSIAAIARWIRARASKPAEGLSQFAKVVCFNYLIGNCDAHLKNFSIMYHNGRKGAVYSLSPAYGLVSTSFFDRFGKDMAMAIGDARDIRDVLPNDFALLAGNLGITANYLKSIAAPIVGTIGTAIHKAGDETLCPSQEFIPYLANDLQEDIAPHLSILEEFANRSNVTLATIRATRRQAVQHPDDQAVKCSAVDAQFAGAALGLSALLLLRPLRKSVMGISRFSFLPQHTAVHQFPQKADRLRLGKARSQLDLRTGTATASDRLDNCILANDRFRRISKRIPIGKLHGERVGRDRDFHRSVNIPVG